jgi:outer membrane lipoprotein carrier protein
MMRQETLAAVLGILWASAAPAQGLAEVVDPAACGEQVVDRVQARYEAVRDLSARFEQTTHSVAFGSSSLASGTPASGHVVFAKPGKMRWTYEKPEPSLVVSDGESVWLYDGSSNDAQRLPVQEGYLTGAALQFLLGGGNLRKEFDVRARGCGSEQVELEFVPTVPASFERLGLTVAAASGEVVATTIVDLLGNKTRLVFADIEVNQAPPEETFRFDPPPGVEVIDMMSPR